MTTDGRVALTLPTDEQILVTRELDAPRRSAYEAWTTPELVRRWWHAKRGEVTTCEIDPRVGGARRYVMVAAGGLEVGFHGEFQEIVPNRRIVSTEVSEGVPGSPGWGRTVDTATFEDVGRRTLLTILVQAPSKTVRDAIVESGMEDGLQDALDLLEEVAAGLR